MRYQIKEEWKSGFWGNKNETFICNEREVTNRFPDAIKQLRGTDCIILNHNRLGIPSKVTIERLR